MFKFAAKQASPAPLLAKHFRGTDLTKLSVSTRTFVTRVRPDLQMALNDILAGSIHICHFSGIGSEHQFMGLDFGSLTAVSQVPAQIRAPEYEAIDIGEEKPIECLKAGLWLLTQDSENFALMMAPSGVEAAAQGPAVNFYLATRDTPAGKAISANFFKQLEEQVQNRNRSGARFYLWKVAAATAALRRASRCTAWHRCTVKT